MPQKGKLSAENKIQFVKDYLGGKRGYMASYQAAGVSEGAFRTWIRLFQTRGSEGLLPARKKMKYSAELKVKVIKEYLQGGISFETLCTKYELQNLALFSNGSSGIIAMRSSDLQTAEVKSTW